MLTYPLLLIFTLIIFKKSKIFIYYWLVINFKDLLYYQISTVFLLLIGTIKNISLNKMISFLPNLLLNKFYGPDKLSCGLSDINLTLGHLKETRDIIELKSSTCLW